MNSSFESITLGDLSDVHGGKSLAQRAVAGMKACLAIPPQSSNSQAGCVQEQSRRYYRARELYGSTGSGRGGLMERRHGITDPVPSTYFLGE